MLNRCALQAPLVLFFLTLMAAVYYAVAYSCPTGEGRNSARCYLTIRMQAQGFY